MRPGDVPGHRGLAGTAEPRASLEPWGHAVPPVASNRALMRVGYEPAPAVHVPNGTPGIRSRCLAVRSASQSFRHAHTRLADGSAPSPSPDLPGRQAHRPSQRRCRGRYKGTALFLGGARSSSWRRRRSRPAAGTSISVWCRTAAAPETRVPKSRRDGPQARGARWVGRKNASLFRIGRSTPLDSRRPYKG